MSLVCMVCHDTEDNGRTEYTSKTIECLSYTVDWNKHELIIVDNGSCFDTKELLVWAKDKLGATIITLPENIGTSRALNLAMKQRKPNHNFVKIDNDIYVHSSEWVDEMDAAIEREPKIGIVGLKRVDLRQTPHDPDPSFKSELIQLPHEAGQTWINIEKTGDIMGSCTMFSSALLDVIGYSYQMTSTYGFEDCLTSLRSTIAGFWNCFLSHIVITHLDRGDNPYTEVKRQIAAQHWDEYRKVHDEYCNGARPIYYDGGFSE